MVHANAVLQHHGRGPAMANGVRLTDRISAAKALRDGRRAAYPAKDKARRPAQIARLCAVVRWYIVPISVMIVAEHAPQLPGRVQVGPNLCEAKRRARGRLTAEREPEEAVSAQLHSAEAWNGIDRITFRQPLASEGGRLPVRDLTTPVVYGREGLLSADSQAAFVVIKLDV